MPTNPIVLLVSQLLNLFCGGNQHRKEQRPQQGYGQYPQHPQQQHHAPQQQQFPQQHQQQQQQYHQPQQQPHYPPQHQSPNHNQLHNGQSWLQVAGGKQQPYHNHQNAHDPAHQPDGVHTSRPVAAGGIIGPHHPAYKDDNQINQANEKYTRLRSLARGEGDQAHRCFAESQQAYHAGDGAAAHELSVQGEAHQKRQDELDDEASAWIYEANNQDSPQGTIDLHGLYVKEAIERTEAAIMAGQRSGQEELQVIVGKGIHSLGHTAKIKPAVEDLMRKYNLAAHLDPHNGGVLIVDLDGVQRNGRTRDPGGLVVQMEQSRETDCVIM